MVAIIHENHRLNQEKKITLENIRVKLFFVKVDAKSLYQKYFLKNNIEFKENLTVQNAETLINIVKNNLGIGIFLNFTIFSFSQSNHDTY
ncbi:hypothetical protein [Heyndrickxia acidicola]|uniref:hypothetical protein n=1 Tax=Heyndrickxia acidicola TaxID=209389 RepID=UPI000826D9F2